MTYLLLKHLLEYPIEQKRQRFTNNERALLDSLTDEPQTIRELAEKLNIQTTTVLRLIKKLSSEYGGIEMELFGHGQASLYWKSEHFGSIYDEI